MAKTTKVKCLPTNKNERYSNYVNQLNQLNMAITQQVHILYIVVYTAYFYLSIKNFSKQLEKLENCKLTDYLGSRERLMYTIADFKFFFNWESYITAMHAH